MPDLKEKNTRVSRTVGTDVSPRGESVPALRPARTSMERDTEPQGNLSNKVARAGVNSRLGRGGHGHLLHCVSPSAKDSTASVLLGAIT